MALVDNFQQEVSYSVDQLIEQFDDTLGQVFQHTPTISVDQLTQQFENMVMQPNSFTLKTSCPYCIQRNTINHKQKEIKKIMWIRSRNIANRIAKKKWINNHGYLSGLCISPEIRENYIYPSTLTYCDLGTRGLYSLFTLLLKHPEIPLYRLEYLGQDGQHYIVPVNLETIINDHYGLINITSIPDQPIEQKREFHDTCFEHTCPRCFRMKSSQKDICWMCKKCDKMIKLGGDATMY